MDEFDDLMNATQYTDDDALNILIEVRESLDRGDSIARTLSYIDAYLIDIGRL